MLSPRLEPLLPSRRLASRFSGEPLALEPADVAASAVAIAVVGNDGAEGSIAGRMEGLDIDDGALFQVASTGKHVTACLILDLANEGRLDLDEDLRVYLPETPAAWGRIPVHTLLHHTSGLPDYLLVSDPPPTDPAGFFAVCSSMKPLAPAGDCWSYSNTNYILLGLIAARVAGQPAGEQIQAILTRHGAASARVAAPDWTRLVNREGGRARGFDHASLQRAVIGDGDVAFDLRSAQAWLEALITPPEHWRTLFRTVPMIEGTALYGAGLFVEPLRGRTFVHHAGHFDGWTAALVLNVEEKVAALAMCNGAPGHTRYIRQLAVSALEAIAPDATPLSLRPIVDPDPDLSAMIQRQLFRGSAPLDRHCFSEAMTPLVSQSHLGRGIINLAREQMPQAVHLVERCETSGLIILRYRIDYGNRLEHLCVGVTPDAKIFWAWPI